MKNYLISRVCGVRDWLMAGPLSRGTSAKRDPPRSANCRQQQTAPQQQNANAPAGNAANGRKLFVSFGCYQCHGYEAQGGSAGPRLAPRPIAYAQFMKYVRHPTSEMPPFTEKIVKDAELTDVYAFLRASLRRATSIRFRFEVDLGNSQLPIPNAQGARVATTCCLGVGRWELGVTRKPAVREVLQVREDQRVTVLRSPRGFDAGKPLEAKCAAVFRVVGVPFVAGVFPHLLAAAAAQAEAASSTAS